MRELWGSPAMWNERKKYVDIAKKLGIDEETVRNRIKFLKESGFLLGWRVTPNPSLLGRRASFLLIETEDKEDIIPKVKGRTGVITIISIYSNYLLLNLFDDEERSSASEISNIPGIKTSPFNTPEMSLPQSNFRMTITDWKIVGLLLRDAERNVNDVAKELHISSRTVKRRLGAMLGASAIFIMPIVNLKKNTGIPYSLMIQSEESMKDELEREVSTRIPNLIFKASFPKGGSIFGFTGSNIAEGNELLKWAKKHRGVKSARIYISEEVLHVYDWLEREVKHRISMGEG
jgi:DNA-binding Lrp family transcriptional regulator